MMEILYGLLGAAVVGAVFVVFEIVSQRKKYDFSNDADMGLW